MKMYEFLYRVGSTPWERYAVASRAGVAAVLDREQEGRARPLGRVLDLGCGRGQYAAELIRRGWEYVGVDNVPRAIEGAVRRGIEGATFLVRDVTRLADGEGHGGGDLGRFDFFFDVGCFQHLDATQRQAAGRGVTALANPGATLLMLEFGLVGMSSVLGGTSRALVEEAFDGWTVLSVEPASTRGLGWPQSRTRPQWYRLERRSM